MRPVEVRLARKALGLSSSKFAELLGVHAVTVRKWETGAQGMRRPVEQLIRLLVEAKAPRKGRRRNGS
jgi:DNA-binding transcriptional regulator YiaG